MACAAAPDPCAAVGEALRDLVGWRLFTVMALDRARGEAARLHTSEPDAYPVGGRKPLGPLAGWGARVIEEGRPWIGRTPADLARVFPDHEAIAALGCGACLNVPVPDASGVVLGTVNLLDRAGHYEPAHAERVGPYADALVDTLARWIEVGPGDA